MKIWLDCCIKDENIISSWRGSKVLLSGKFILIVWFVYPWFLAAEQWNLYPRQGTGPVSKKQYRGGWGWGGTREDLTICRCLSFFMLSYDSAPRPPPPPPPLPLISSTGDTKADLERETICWRERGGVSLGFFYRELSAAGGYNWLPAPLEWKLANARNTVTVENNRNWAELLLHSQ